MRGLTLVGQQLAGHFQALQNPLSARVHLVSGFAAPFLRSLLLAECNLTAPERTTDDLEALGEAESEATDVL